MAKSFEIVDHTMIYDKKIKKYSEYEQPVLIELLI